MKRTILVGMVAVAMSSVVLAEGFSLNPFMLLKQKDSNRYATKMAESIQNRPECQKFKDEIMTHAKGSPYEAKTAMAIISVKEKAKTAGCAQ